MSALQSWLIKPRATVRIDTAVPWGGLPWGAWMKSLCRNFQAKPKEDRPRIELLDRLSLGGKKSLLLVSIEGQRLLVGVGEDAAPSISALDAMRPAATPGGLQRTRTTRIANRRRLVR